MNVLNKSIYWSTLRQMQTKFETKGISSISHFILCFCFRKVAGSFTSWICLKRTWFDYQRCIFTFNIFCRNRIGHRKLLCLCECRTRVSKHEISSSRLYGIYGICQRWRFADTNTNHFICFTYDAYRTWIEK